MSEYTTGQYRLTNQKSGLLRLTGSHTSATDVVRYTTGIPQWKYTQFELVVPVLDDSSPTPKPSYFNQSTNAPIPSALGIYALNLFELGATAEYIGGIPWDGINTTVYPANFGNPIVQYWLAEMYEESTTVTIES